MYFESVQNFLPLLHKPSVYTEFLKQEADICNRYEGLSSTDAILLNSMFALSARFSEWNQCWNVSPGDRGVPFARKAQALWNAHVSDDIEPSLRLLQSRILLSFYELTSAPSYRAWHSAGVCCRMAYSLSLHRIDCERVTHNATPAYGQTWTEKEERRRAWWAVYQLDNVASVVSCRPFNLDTSNMEVLLPAPDEDWFSHQFIESVPISPRPAESWKSLQKSDNQNPYAWFLVINELVRHAQKLWDNSHRSMDELKVMQSALHCFALALPPSFRLTPSNMVFNDHNFVEKNWTICTIVLLQA